MTVKQLLIIQAYLNSSQDGLDFTEPLKSFECSIEAFTFQLNSILRTRLEITNLNNFLTIFDPSFELYKSENILNVYRGCNYFEMLRWIQNDKYLDNGYISTSKRIEIAQKFIENPSAGYFPAILEITIPQNTGILDIDKISGLDNSSYENEVLIKRSSLFDVLSDTELDSNSNCNIIGDINTKNHPKFRFSKLNFNKYI